ncbi:hypothetical protein DFH07DRAFT_833230 [Mycena maculata]|uniref:Uncharacterized protein n=1 Tax=Mycena maculata TaxID=230809 RepID=A0AAD7ILF8_9AGAR|nr:hypothetical protein DFH07DRAFT_833230 [Mycena maculata]
MILLMYLSTAVITCPLWSPLSSEAERATGISIENAPSKIINGIKSLFLTSSNIGRASIDCGDEENSEGSNDLEGEHFKT